MTHDLDHYEAYYADKLWNLLPAIYRAEDTDNFSSNGPLREMVNRIGAQAAILRRSIDRVWEDQSIETCDDWIIPYIGDLLATNLVDNLDARGQRKDVAKTIYYRRRKGTLAILEEIASDITGWDAKVIEFFRRLGRTRHGFDPSLGVPEAKSLDRSTLRHVQDAIQSVGFIAAASFDEVAALQLAEGLVGPISRTGIGGFADLRNVYGASKAASAFDEYFYTADFRRGRGQVGWHNIPRLGVFLWRLKSFDVSPTTPVAVTDCHHWFTFDPTGRDIPLFGASRTAEAYGSKWVSPDEAQLPTPISQPLLDANENLPPEDTTVRLYPDSLAVLSTPAPKVDADFIPFKGLKICPETGRFEYIGSPPLDSPAAGVWVKYHYGFSSEIGAGPYDRRVGRKTPPTPDPVRPPETGGGLLTSLTVANLSGTATLGDSLTYTVSGGSPGDAIQVQGPFTLRAENKQRPLIRLPEGPVGTSFEWVFASKDQSCLVLDGLFISGGDIVLRGDFDCVTITCCTLDPGSTPRKLSSPPAIFAHAADRRELVPTRLWIEGGIVGTLAIERSITGPILTRAGGKVETVTITDSIVQAIPNSTPGTLSSPPDSSPPESPPKPSSSDTALALDDGEVHLSRCTVMGQISVHRLDASECILRDFATVDDTQRGCVRFTAWADGSVLPRKYESVRIPPGAPVFTSTDVGQPGFGQLLPTADSAILPAADATGAPQNTISEGAEDGSEMGAFAREKNPIKERGLLIKYQEFMPAGLVPVVVYVT
jgi:hypothetical protein